MKRLSGEKRILSSSLLISVLIHGGVVLVLFNTSFAEIPDAPATESPLSSIAITLVKSDPEQETVGTPPATGEEGGQAEAPVALQSEIPENTVPDAADLVVTEVPPATEPLETDIGDAVVSPAEDSKGEESGYAFVTRAISDYIAGYQGELNEKWAEDCQRYRNRYPTKDCPGSLEEGHDPLVEERDIAREIFAIVTHDADQARISRQIERESRFLKEIIEAGGPAAEQAGIRSDINNRYQNYLNGNINPTVAAFNTMTGFSNDYGRTVLPRPYQFRCRKIPCTYKFTGFEVKRPENPVEKEPGFQLRPPLFKPSKD